MNATTSNRATVRVAVVMACYNGEATLAEAIDSVRRQSMEDWELVIVDDGSTDESPEIVEQYAGLDARVRLERQPNQGPSRARNRGVELTCAPYVAFLDADDVWDESHLALTTAELDCDSRLGIAFAPSRIVSSDGTSTGETTRAFTGNVTREVLLSCNPTATCSAVVVRREAIERAGPMREDMIHAEDQEWLFRIHHSGWAIRGIPQATVGYRTSPSGLSANVPKMMSGWQTFIGHARALAPDIRPDELLRATARMQLYYAQRSMRANDAPSVARHMLAAVRAFPGILAERPRTVLAVTLTTAMPNLVGGLIDLLRSFTHARDPARTSIQRRRTAL